GFADHADDLARRDRERHVLDRVRSIRAMGQAHGKALHVEDGRGHRLNPISVIPAEAKRRAGTHTPRNVVSGFMGPGSRSLRSLARDDSEGAHHTRRASLGSSLSRNPSPSTLTASTVRARQMPGKKMLCG